MGVLEKNKRNDKKKGAKQNGASTPVNLYVYLQLFCQTKKKKNKQVLSKTVDDIKRIAKRTVEKIGIQDKTQDRNYAAG